MTAVRGIIFDGDDTLWDFAPSMRGALQLSLEELWSRRPETVGGGMDIEQMMAIRNNVAAELAGRVDDLAVVRVAAFERTLEVLGVSNPALAAEIAASYFAHRARLLTAGEDTMAVLEQLSGYVLAYSSNGTSLPTDLGLGGHFVAALRSVDHGTAKPDPGMLLALATEMDLVVEHIVMVGDTQAEDIAAAHQAGMRSVLISAEVDDSLPLPTHVAASLGDLPDVIALMDSPHAE